MKLRHLYTAMLLLLLVPACDLQAPEFVDYEFDGYSIALPTRQPVAHGEEGLDGKISSVSAEVDGIKYLVVYWELPMHLRGVSDAQILEAMSLGTGSWKVIKQNNVMIAGMPGKEIEGESATGKHMITRILRTKDRIYLLTVGGNTSTLPPAGIKRFFDSFKMRVKKPGSDSN